MANEWVEISNTIDSNGIQMVSIKEISTENVFSVKLHKKYPVKDFKTALKKAILEDRDKTSVDAPVKNRFDFTNFEAELGV